MSNMSYCRFENTARDLEDCYEALGNGVRKKYFKHYQGELNYEI